MCILLLVTTLTLAPTFRDATAEFGLTLDTGQAAWVDLNGDGYPELVAGGRVWLNREGQRFEAGEKVGGVVAADIDNDGDVDLFSSRALKLYLNGGDGALTEMALPELPAMVSLAACFADLNGDGYVDLYLAGYERWKEQITYPDLVLMNRGGTAFELVATKEGRRARGVTAADFDRDGDLDIYVSNYRLQPNNLWLNDGQGGLSDQAAKYGVVATSQGFGGGHSIGACWGDFDGDGWLDLFAGNFAHVDNRGDQPKSRFLRNRGPEAGCTFDDRGTCGIFYQESYATPAAGDYDNDGALDLFFTTVYGTASFGKKNYPVLYRNAGGWTFEDVSEGAGVSGLPPTYQAAWADFDRDGDLDLVSGGKLLVNQTPGRHWLELDLRGDGTKVNRAAVGAQARVTVGDRVLTRQVEAGTGEGNQNDLVLHFGLGDEAGPLTVEVFWPTGETEVLEGVPVDRLVPVVYGAKG